MLGGAKIGDFGGAQRGARSVEIDSFNLIFNAFSCGDFLSSTLRGM